MMRRDNIKTRGRMRVRRMRKGRRKKTEGREEDKVKEEE